MNKNDIKRLDAIAAQADTLMNVPPSLDTKVFNSDIIEALLADIALVSMDKNPKWLAELIERDAKG